MDRIEKALKKLTAKERRQIRGILEKIKKGTFNGLDIKRLKGGIGVYRVRKGDLRIIYRIEKGGKISVLAIERRSERTYK